MILRFATYEEAGIYAAWMRSEGHYAAVLDENMGFIWGPLAIGGFRVVVLAFTLLGLISGVVLMIRLPVFHAADLIALAIRSGMLLALFCVLGPGMIPVTRALRDKRSIFGGCIRGLVVLHVAAQLLVMGASFVYAIWHEMHRR